MNNKHIINHLLNNKKMKKSLLFAAALTILFAGCQKNDEKDDKVKELEVEFTLEKIEALPYGEPVNLSGSFTGTTAVSKAVFSGAKKAEDGTFTVVGEGQEGTIDGTVASVEFFADSQEIDAIEVVLSSADASKKFYFDAPKVTGEPKGDVWFNDVVALYPDNIVKNNKNCPEEFPTPNTGAGSDTKSFFSMHGVKVNGKVEHILSLNELLAVDGKNASFCFLNVLQNTENNKFIGSQRGYMFSIAKASSLGGGTTGRQCDLYQYGEHQIKDENIDLNFKMNRYRGIWSGENYKEEIFKEIDRIFLNLKSPKTNLEKIKAFYALGEIQRKLDNSTLGEEENPTNFGGSTFLRKWNNAGENTTAPTEQYRAGDYIIFRSERKKEGEEKARYYYGIMQIIQFGYDDSKCFVEKDGMKYIDREMAKDLFMKPVYLDIKTQCEIAE